MYQCMHCFDWFHNDCIGVTGNDLDAHYLCSKFYNEVFQFLDKYKFRHYSENNEHGLLVSIFIR